MFVLSARSLHLGLRRRPLRPLHRHVGTMLPVSSPIVIDASPPAISFPAPTATFPSICPQGTETSPHRLRKDADKSSSPSLLSPSALLRSRPAGLKSGSRVQQLPTDINTGFSTVTTLWKSHHFAVQGEVRQNTDAEAVNPRKRKAKTAKNAVAEDAEEPVECLKYSPGKLVRLQKKRKTERTSDVGGKPHEQSAQETSVFFPRTQSLGRRLQQPSHIQTSNITISEDVAPCSRSSFTFAELDFQEEDHERKLLQANHPVLQKAMTPVRQKVKKKEAQCAPGENAQSKHARKRRTKSASFILNSDEPDQDCTTMAMPPVEKVRGQTNEAPHNLQSFLDESAEKSTALAHPSIEMASMESIKPSSPARSSVDLNAVAVEWPLAEDIPSKQISVVDTIAQAPKRRLSWTPVQDTSLSGANGLNVPPASIVQDDLERDDTKHSEMEYDVPNGGFATLLGSFMHMPAASTCGGNVRRPSVDTGVTSVPPMIKTRAKKSALKKRRAVKGLNADSAEIQPKPDKPKRARASTSRVKKVKAAKEKQPKERKGKKKIQTITALATAGFARPQEVAQVNVPPKEQHGSDNHALGRPTDRVGRAEPTSMLSTAYRTKTLGDDEKDDSLNAYASITAQGQIVGTADQAQPAKAKAKSKKSAKSRPKKQDLVHPGHGLHSPDVSIGNMEKQNFLFGTSSQLRLEESATFIRDLQTAMEESTLVPGLFQGRVDDLTQDHEVESTLHSPAQPHVNSESSSKVKSRGSAIRIPTAPHGTNLSVQQADRELWSVSARDFKGQFMPRRYNRPRTVPYPSGPSIRQGHDFSAMPPEDHVDGVARHLDRSSPKHDEPALLPGESEIANEDVNIRIGSMGEFLTSHHDAKGARIERPFGDDSWMLLRSDESVAVPARRSIDGEDQDMLPKSIAFSSHRVHYSPEKVHPSYTSPIPLRSPTRSPLRLLDQNLPLPLAKGLEKSLLPGAARTLTSSAVDGAKLREVQPSPAKRGPGRPRKDSGGAAMSPTAVSKTKATGPSNKRGRPRKMSGQDAFQDLVGSPPTSGRWVDVDEISDSDTPVTPSPPRRKKSKINSAPLPALQLSPSASQGEPEAHRKNQLLEVAEEVAASSSGFSLRTGDCQWSTMRAEVFETITKTIRQSRAIVEGNGEKRITWYQRILLYDPIVVEDLTTWLNAQGLRVNVRKTKPKPKVKGKKAGGDVVNDDHSSTELVREPLQAWMVQKWCQENSVCCIAQESGWRGGRTKNI